MGEQDAKISLLQRLVEHALNTARYNIYYGEGRDTYDVRGRTAHEAVFNVASGVFRCPNSQQGYAPFSTWTRGLAWAVYGFAEELEFVSGQGCEQFSRIDNARYQKAKPSWWDETTWKRWFDYVCDLEQREWPGPASIGAENRTDLEFVMLVAATATADSFNSACSHFRTEWNLCPVCSYKTSERV